MTLTVEQRELAAIVTITSESLASRNIKEFRRGMKRPMDEYGSIVLDLHNVTFMDSSGIGALLTYLRLINKRGGQFCPCGLTPAVRTLFELIRVHRIFTIYDNPEEAIAALTKQETSGRIYPTTREPLQLIVEQREPVAVIGILSEYLEISNAHDFTALMEPLLAKYTTIVLNMRDITYMDIHGMVALLACLIHSNKRGGKLVLCWLNPCLHILFETSARNLFEIYKNPEESVAALTKQG